MAKLTLNVDSEVISRAKQYSKLRGVSVSKLVEVHLDSIAGETSTPVLQAVLGILKTADIGDYREYLESKYRG